MRRIHSTLAALLLLTGCASSEFEPEPSLESGTREPAADAQSTTDTAPPTDARDLGPDPGDASVRPDVPPGACPRPCFLTAGVCAGAMQACGEATCNYGAHSADFVPTEDMLNCDQLDNDCDGRVDEACDCQAGATAECGGGPGLCTAGTQRCIDGAWSLCEGAGQPTDESCNGLDDDCDGLTDERVPAVQCENQRGVCAGATAVCGGARGWLPCDDGRYNRNNPRYSPTETALNCDGEDNDCDGQTDETCECRPGETQACGQNVGRCQAGEQQCVSGAFGACSGRGPGEEDCNGEDDDCDRSTDEDARCGGDETCQSGECVRTRWVFEAESGAAGHEIGRQDGDGWSANTGDDREGMLLFGPYTRDIPAGRYIARFRMRIDNNNADNNTVVQLQINDFDGRAPNCGDCVIARQSVRRRDFAQPQRDQDFGLGFDNRGGRRLEFRVEWFDIAYVRIDRVEVVRAD